MTLLLSGWYMYGSISLLNGLLTNPEFVASFDQLHINAGKTYFKVMAYFYPFALLLLMVSCITVLRGSKVSALIIVLISVIFLANEIITQIMDDKWLHQAFVTPHFTPILYVFNAIVFTTKLYKNEKEKL